MLLLSPLFVKLMFVVVVLLLVVELNAVVIQPESVVVAVVLLAAAVSLAVAVELVELVESVELVSFEDFLELSFADQCFVEQFVESENTLISGPLYFILLPVGDQLEFESFEASDFLVMRISVVDRQAFEVQLTGDPPLRLEFESFESLVVGGLVDFSYLSYT